MEKDKGIFQILIEEFVNADITVDQVAVFGNLIVSSGKADNSVI